MADARVILFVVLLFGCGAAAPRASAPAAGPTPATVSRAPWSITFANDSVLAYAASGALTLDGEAIGVLSDDGRLVQGGEEIASLEPDGTVRLHGEVIAPRVEGSRLVESGNAALEIDETDTLHVRAPDGREIGTFVADGATPDARATVLFLTTVYLLDAAEAQDRAAERATEDGAVADEDDEADDLDEDLWRMPIDDAPSEGPLDALVTIVELTDFQCPYCSRGAATMSAIRARFPDDVRLVVRQRPLPFHENARPAAEAALEARAQLGDEAFFRMAALLFANQRNLTRPTLEALAVAVGLDLPRFRRALDDEIHEDAIARDEELGDRLGAEGTPTFYVNGELIVGAQPLPSIVHAVERARARAQDALAHGASRERLYDALLAHAQDRAGGDEEEIPPAPEARFADLAVPSDAPALGATSARARTTVQLFLDLGSRHAASARALVDRLTSDPVRAVRVVLRLTPRESGAAHTASEAVMAVAAAAGPELAFRYALELASAPDALSPARLGEVAAQVAHVPAATIRDALEGHPLRGRIDRDRRALHDASLWGSPVVFLAGRRVVWGVPTPETLLAAVDASLAAPDEGHPSAPSDVRRPPSGAHAVAGGASFLTEHAGEGEGAETALLGRWAMWDATGLVLDDTAAAPLRVRLDALPESLRAALTGIRAGEIRRIWVPGDRVFHVEAVDVE